MATWLFVRNKHFRWGPGFSGHSQTSDPAPPLCSFHKAILVLREDSLNLKCKLEFSIFGAAIRTGFMGMPLCSYPRPLLGLMLYYSHLKIVIFE
jgi:hypothetical protein